MIIVLQLLVLGALAGWGIARVLNTRDQSLALGQIGFGVISAITAGVIIAGLGLSDFRGLILYSLALASVGVFVLSDLRQKFHT